MPQLSEFDTSDMAICRGRLRSGSRSFSAAARMLPKAIRDPTIALYAFCREADDVIDGDSASEGQDLDWLRHRLNQVYAGHPLPLPVDRAFALVVDRFAIPRCLPEALLEGFEWDAECRRYPDLPALRAYAVRVAGTVGAMMAVIMGVRDRGGLAAAIDLGVAMQLSNIARDVGEDARNGRLYLPLDWLDEAGIDPDAFLAAPEHSAALGRVVDQVLQAADRHYQQATAGISRLPMGCRLGVGVARLLYAEIGQEVRRRGLDCISTRAVVARHRKGQVVAKGLVSMMLPLRPVARTCVPEGRFLMDAVIQSSPRPAAAGEVFPWWALAKRLQWMIELFERMERRERMQP